MGRLAAAVTAAALVFTCSAALAAPADRIVTRGAGRPVVADQVTQDHYDEVKYKRGGIEVALPAARVRAIEYGDEPESFQLGLDKRAAGEFENAVTLLRSAAGEKGVRDWIKVAAPFEVGQTYLMWGARERGRFADAVKAFDEALAAAPKSRLRPRILHGKAQAELGSGALDQGIATLDQLAKEAYDNKYGVEWELKATYEKAAALEEAGKGDDARREYAKLETNARSFAGQEALEAAERQLAAELAGLARLAQGRVLIQNGKASDAERFYAQITGDAAEVDAVRAAARVGQGSAMQAQGKLKEAQLAYATVVVRHAGAREAVAEATYRLGLVAAELGAAEPKGAKLAQDYFSEVAQRYADTRWARLAQEKLR